MLAVLYIAYMSGAVILEWEHPCYWPNVVKVLTCGPNTPLFAMQRGSDGRSSQGLAALNPVYLNCYVWRLPTAQPQLSASHGGIFLAVPSVLHYANLR